MHYVKQEDLDFEGCTINGVCVRPKATFDNSDDDLWFRDLIDRAIPAMGEKYTELFIWCGFHPYVFLSMAQRLSAGTLSRELIDEIW